MISQNKNQKRGSVACDFDLWEAEEEGPEFKTSLSDIMCSKASLGYTVSDRPRGLHNESPDLHHCPGATH